MEPTYLSLRDLMGKDFPAPTWLVDQLIPAGATTVISAAPGSYKTWLLFETALAVARGGLLFGKFKTLQGGVLVLDGESGERQLKDRLVKLGASEDLQISFLDCERFVVNEKSMDTLLADCIRLNAKFVIVDTLVTVHSADENSPGDMTEIFKQFKRLAKVGIAVVVAHHNRKSGTKVGSAGDEMRGSSGILASVDCHIGVSRRKGSRTVTLEQTKNRFAEELKPFRLLLTGNTKKSETLAFEYVGEIVPQKDSGEVLKETVYTLIYNNGELCQKDLLVLLDEAQVPTNEHVLRPLLISMVQSQELLVVKGIGNTKNYRLGPMAPDQDVVTPEAE